MLELLIRIGLNWLIMLVGRMLRLLLIKCMEDERRRKMIEEDKEDERRTRRTKNEEEKEYEKELR